MNNAIARHSALDQDVPKQAGSKKKLKTKKKGIQEDEDMDDGDDEDDDNDHPSDEDYSPTKRSKEGPNIGDAETEQMETAIHSVEEEMATAAQFSVNTIDLFDPPMTIYFGKWNGRLLDQKQVKKLKAALTAQGIKPFSHENMMPLVINQRHVDPSCIENTANGYNAKPLILSDEGKRELVRLDMAGGRHRKAAIASIKADKQKELTALTNSRNSVSKRKVKKADAIQKKQDEIETYNKRIEVVKKEIENIGKWGVILYDEGIHRLTYVSVMMTYMIRLTEKLKEDEAEKLFQYLSQNIPVQRYVQTDGEALLQAITLYVGYMNSGNEIEAKRYAARCRKKNHLMNVNLSMPNKEARELAANLYKLQGYMGHTPAFTSKWMATHIIGIYGGVSDELHEQ